MTYKLECCDSLDWLTCAAHKSIDAIVTDPPFGVVEYDAASIKGMREGSTKGVWRNPPEFDGSRRAPLPRFTTADTNDVASFFRSFAALALPILKPGGHMVVAATTILAPFVFEAIASAGFQYRGAVYAPYDHTKGR